MALEPVWITLRGLAATGFHGVLEHERRDGQTFSVDLRFETALEPGHDDLSATVNYAEVASTVVDRITGAPVQLIETLASHIADDVLAINGVRTVEVTVHKPQAPVPVAFTDVAVTVIRSNS